MIYNVYLYDFFAKIKAFMVIYLNDFYIINDLNPWVNITWSHYFMDHNELNVATSHELFFEKP